MTSYDVNIYRCQCIDSAVNSTRQVLVLSLPMKHRTEITLPLLGISIGSYSVTVPVH